MYRYVLFLYQQCSLQSSIRIQVLNGNLFYFKGRDKWRAYKEENGKRHNQGPVHRRGRGGGLAELYLRNADERNGNTKTSDFKMYFLSNCSIILLEIDTLESETKSGAESSSTSLSLQSASVDAKPVRHLPMRQMACRQMRRVKVRDPTGSRSK